MLKSFAVLAVAASLAGCDSPSSRVSQFRFGSADTLATTGNLRLITERSRYQQDGSVQRVMCTEPSPDYAIAFGTTAAAGAKADITGAGSGEGSASLATTEAATQLAGRTAGVLALRDGLYAACQSYVNGVIGHDAYAMILSQYGTLLVALAGGSGGSGGGGASNTPSAASAGPNASQQAALAALLVSCISEHDQTRSGGQNNTLLDKRFCKGVVSTALRYAVAGK